MATAIAVIAGEGAQGEHLDQVEHLEANLNGLNELQDAQGEQIGQHAQGAQYTQPEHLDLFSARSNVGRLPGMEGMTDEQVRAFNQKVFKIDYDASCPSNPKAYWRYWRDKQHKKEVVSAK